MNDLIPTEPIVENEEVKQNLAAELLPIIADRKKVAEILMIDPKAIDIWMENVDFLIKLHAKIEENKNPVNARLQQDTLEIYNIIEKKYKEASELVTIKANKVSSALLKTLGEQYLNLRKLIKHDHKEPTIIEERQQATLMNELGLLPEGEQIRIIRGIKEIIQVTNKPLIDINKKEVI